MEDYVQSRQSLWAVKRIMPYVRLKEIERNASVVYPNQLYIQWMSPVLLLFSLMILSSNSGRSKAGASCCSFLRRRKWKINISIYKEAGDRPAALFIQ